MIRPRLLMATAAGVALLLAACTGDADPTPAATPAPGDATAQATVAPVTCDTLDPVLAEASFVLVTSAVAGQPVAAGDTIEGCSRTFESHVDWMLEDREGNVVASGFTMGGGVDGAGAFTFTVGAYTVAEPQVGHLVVAAPDPSGGEGFPPSTHRIPVVLLP